MNRCLTSVIVLAFLCLVISGPALAAGDTAGLLAETDVFKGLTGPQLESVAGVATSRQAEKGEYLIRAGDPVEYLFFLKSGEGTIRLADGRVAGKMNVGHVVGELEFISGKKAVADVCMDTAGEVLSIAFTALRQLMDADPAMGYCIAENMARKISTYAEGAER